MQVICGVRSHEGAQRREPAGCSWQRGGTKWGITHPCHPKLGLMRSRMDQRGGVMIDTGLIKVASGWGRSVLKGGGGACPGISVLFHVLRQLRGTLVLVVVEGGVAGKNPLSREGNHGGRLSRWLGGDKGSGSFRADDADARMNDQGDEDPRERWFRKENSHVEIRTLTCLEDDLNSSLLFEHGGGQRASPLWIARILLGRLSRERMALGKAVEVFTKL